MAACSGITKQGARCRAPAMSGSAYCLNHDPTKVDQQRRRSSKGGRAGGRGRPSGELRALHARFVEIADNIEAGMLDKSVGIAMVQALNGARACMRDLLAAREQEELVERLEVLEEGLAARKEGFGYGP
jgi:hypothetical protein